MSAPPSAASAAPPPHDAPHAPATPLRSASPAACACSPLLPAFFFLFFPDPPACPSRPLFAPSALSVSPARADADAAAAPRPAVPGVPPRAGCSKRRARRPALASTSSSASGSRSGSDAPPSLSAGANSPAPPCAQEHMYSSYSHRTQQACAFEPPNVPVDGQIARTDA